MRTHYIKNETNHRRLIDEPTIKYDTIDIYMLVLFNKPS